MAELITNADDVDVIIEPETGDTVRVNANEFTMSNEQDVASVSDINHKGPRGLSKGNMEFSFDFTIEGDQPNLQEVIIDDDGDSIPFAMRAEKPTDTGAGVEWRYELGLALADTDEISGTTGEPLGYTVEGMGADFDRTIN